MLAHSTRRYKQIENANLAIQVAKDMGCVTKSQSFRSSSIFKRERHAYNKKSATTQHTSTCHTRRFHHKPPPTQAHNTTPQLITTPHKLHTHTQASSWSTWAGPTSPQTKHRPKPPPPFYYPQQTPNHSQIAHPHSLVIVNVGGPDLVDRNKKLLLALVGQIMRRYTLGLLRRLGWVGGWA